MMDDKTDVLVNQCESAITMKYLGMLSYKKIMEVEAYAALYALGSYTYNNIVQKVPDKQCNLANDEEVDTDNDLEDEEGIEETDLKIDEEALINQKSPYKQKFIRKHR